MFETRLKCQTLNEMIKNFYKQIIFELTQQTLTALHILYIMSNEV